MSNVLTNLEALASGIGKQDEDMLFNFYSIANARLLKTEEEREAFRLGALALFAGIAKMRLKHWYYTRKFRKAIKQL